MFKINKSSDTFFLFAILILALFSRLILAPLYVSPPGEAYSTIPHDFPKYVATAETILQNRVLYIDRTHTDNNPSPYGPLLALSWAFWIKAFGQDYVFLKVPSIIFDTLTVIMIFFVTKSFFNTEAAKYASLFYAFSFIPLLVSGAEATGDTPLMFFLILSIYLLVKPKPNVRLSSFFLGIALMFKLLLGALFIPLIFYYFFQQKNVKKGLIYIGITLLTIFIISMPFFFKAGLNVLSAQLYYANSGSVTGTTLLSAVKMVVNFITLGMSYTYDYNSFVQMLVMPFKILSFIGIAVYILKFSLKNKRIELIRNIFLLILTFTVFGDIGYSHIFVWLIPYLVVLIFYNQAIGKFRLSTSLVIGLIFIVASTILYAALYRETKIPEYSTWEQSLLLTSVTLATIGTYLMLRRIKLRIPWTLSVFSWAWWLTNHAKLLMIFGSSIELFSNPLWAYGIQDFSSVILITLSSLFLLVSIHRQTQNHL